jgi:hypothetical protein
MCRKLHDEIQVNLNQMKTFEIITLIPNYIGNHIHFNNPIPNNYDELRKSNWTIPIEVVEYFWKNSKS